MGCLLFKPASNAREATRNAPRGSGFRQHDTYAREDAAPTDREPSARRKHARERVFAGTPLGFFLPSSTYEILLRKLSELGH